LHCVDQAVDPLVLPLQYAASYAELGMQIVMIPHTLLFHGKTMSAYTPEARAIVLKRIEDYHDFCLWLERNWNSGDREALDRAIVDRAADQYTRANQEPHSAWEDRWAIAMSEFSAFHIINLQDPTICQLQTALRASTLMQYAQSSTDPKHMNRFLMQ